MISYVAPTEATVLVTGESGVGKGLVADTHPLGYVDAANTDTGSAFPPGDRG